MLSQTSAAVTLSGRAPSRYVLEVLKKLRNNAVSGHAEGVKFRPALAGAGPRTDPVSLLARQRRRTAAAAAFSTAIRARAIPRRQPRVAATPWLQLLLLRRVIVVVGFVGWRVSKDTVVEKVCLAGGARPWCRRRCRGMGRVARRETKARCTRRPKTTLAINYAAQAATVLLRCSSVTCIK